MLIPHDGAFLGGPYDVLCILHYEQAGTYHPAFLEEMGMPGGKSVDEQGFVRLKSKMHRTTGFTSLEEAKINLFDDLAKRVAVPEENIWPDPLAWDGTPGIVLVVTNWREMAQ